MKSLENVDRTSLSTDLIMDMLKLYQFKGKDFYYAEALKSRTTQMVNYTIERDSFYTEKLLDFEISDYRLRMLIKKHSPGKNSQETVVANIVESFAMIQDKIDTFDLITNEIFSLGRFIFGSKKFKFKTDVYNDTSTLFNEKKRKSRRMILEQLLETYNKKLKEDKYETTLLITNFYVDFINLEIFDTRNDIIGLYILYLLLFRAGFKVFKYVSFFQLVYENKAEFDEAIAKACYDWKDGYAVTGPLNKVIVKLMLQGYYKIETELRNVDFDKKVKKTNDIEATILRLPQIFTKEMIRDKQSYVSDSTINRTLKRLSEEGKVRANGVGRSAKWIRLVEYDNFEPCQPQLDMFELMSQLNNDEKASE